MLVSLAIAGIALSWSAARHVDGSAIQARVSELQATADEMAAIAATELAQAIDDTASIASTLSSSPPDELETFWRTSFDFFRGNSGVFVIAEVDPSEVEQFTRSMAATVPGFEMAVGPDPQPPRHLLVVSGAPDAAPFLGQDLARWPALGEILDGTRPDRVIIDGFDTRKSEPDTGDMRVVQAHRYTDPDGSQRQGWTTTFVDLAAILDPLVARLGENHGASFSTDLTGDAGTYGLEQARTDFVATSSSPVASNGGQVGTRTNTPTFDLTVTTWSDGTHVPTSSPRTTFLVGLLITAAVVALGVCALVIRLLLDRADRSNEVARHDALTGLPNRRWLLEFEPDSLNCAVLFCDLDRFKIVNDSAGHSVGDELLVAVADRLQDVVGGEGTVCRFGGDEFLVVCTTGHEDPTDVGVELARRVLGSFDDAFETASHSLRTTLSIGIATRQGTARPIAEIIREADVALGDCKRRRTRGGFVLYDDTFRDAEKDRLLLESQLQDALDAGDFEIHYQPIVGQDGSPYAFEALVRWTRGGRLLAPGRFLPIVADIQRMDDLGRIVLEQALDTFREAFGGDAGAQVQLQVNVDAIQLEDERFPASVATLVESSGVEPHRLTLELTEGEWLESWDRIAPVLDELTDLGIGIAIDDFGSGYSSVERLLAIRGLTEIKLDRSLVAAAVADRTAGFLSGLVDSFDRLGVRIVAEGIETVEEFQRVRALGVTGFQGYLFARPGPADAVGLSSNASAMPSARSTEQMTT